MTLLNHLFRSKKDSAKELKTDDKKRIKLWQEHIDNYPKREELVKFFNYKNVDMALKDFNALNEVLGQIEALVSKELINIDDEEKLDHEILDDLKKLKSRNDIENISRALVYDKRKTQALIELFLEIHNVLKAELHLIRLIRKKPENLKALILQLFDIVNFNEAMLYKAFRKDYYFDPSLHKEIVRIANMFLLEQEWEDAVITDEEKFADDMVLKMSNDYSKHHYRILGMNIYEALAKSAGAPVEEFEETEAVMKKFRVLMADDDFMYKLIKKIGPKYNELKIKAAIIAFRKAFDLGAYMELEYEFLTKE